jgi:hypothetical protein
LAKMLMASLHGSLVMASSEPAHIRQKGKRKKVQRLKEKSRLQGSRYEPKAAQKLKWTRKTIKMRTANGGSLALAR